MVAELRWAELGLTLTFVLSSSRDDSTHEWELGLGHEDVHTHLCSIDL